MDQHLTEILKEASGRASAGIMTTEQQEEHNMHLSLEPVDRLSNGSTLLVTEALREKERLWFLSHKTDFNTCIVSQ